MLNFVWKIFVASIVNFSRTIVFIVRTTCIEAIRAAATYAVLRTLLNLESKRTCASA